MAGTGFLIIRYETEHTLIGTGQLTPPMPFLLDILIGLCSGGVGLLGG